MEALKGAAVTLNMAANAELRVRLWGGEKLRLTNR